MQWTRTCLVCLRSRSSCMSVLHFTAIPACATCLQCLLRLKVSSWLLMHELQCAIRG
jgi:hypothetical protein